ALCDGRLDAADALARRSHEWSRLLTGRDASGVYGMQMFGVRREQGRLAELAPVIRILAGQRGSTGPWRPGLVAVLVELGMEAEARRELARVRAEGLQGFRESLWLASLTFLTDACTALRDEATAVADASALPALLARIRTLGASAPAAALPDGLSAREVQILGLVARGLSNREIGGTLSISEHTAANHIRSILRKTGCANRTEAASYAHRHRLASI